MSETKVDCKESIFSVSGFILGIISIVIAFVPFLNYLAIVSGILSIIFGIMGIGQEGRKKVACVGIILSILSIIITYIIINYKNDFIIGNIYNVSNELNESYNNENNNSEDVLKNQVDVILGDFEITSEVDDFEMMNNTSKLPVTLKNKSNEIKSFNVTIEAVDEEGNRITEEQVYVEKLRPNQSYETEAFNYASDEMAEKLENAKFVVLDASSY